MIILMVILFIIAFVILVRSIIDLANADLGTTSLKTFFVLVVLSLIFYQYVSIRAWRGRGLNSTNIACYDGFRHPFSNN